jgi:hypothetical protein
LALVLSGTVAAALAAALFFARSLVRTPPQGLMVRNFRGAAIPVVGGLVLVAGILAGELTLAVLGLVSRGAEAAGALSTAANTGLLLLALGFFGLGAADDLLGRAGAGSPDASLGASKGLRGHARALRSGVVTGGVVKAAGGAALGLIAGAFWERELVPALLDGVVVALAANLLNLFDLRPGRAAKVFLVLAAILLVAGVATGSLPVLAATTAAVLVWLPLDLGERAMLGDAGANLLGAVLGGAAVLEAGTGGKVVLAAVLAALTLASERWSFTAVIERVPPLRWADRLGRLRP